MSYEYPSCRADLSVENWFGTTLTDPYGWMRNAENPETVDFTERENAFTYGAENAAATTKAQTDTRFKQLIHTAISAAETGHLVITTLHTRGAVNAIDRIIDAFPSSQQAQIRIQLASVLRTVVSQHLLPDVGGGLVPVHEILHLNSAVKNMIREGKNHQIDNAIASGAKEGMITMDKAILARYKMGSISRQTALEYADHPEQLERLLGL